MPRQTGLSQPPRVRALFLLSFFLVLAFGIGDVASAPLQKTWDISGTVTDPLGSKVDVSGDFDGDGWRDLVVVISDRRSIDIYRGSPGGWSTVPSWVLTSPEEGLEFGASLAACGDFDGDDRSDLAVGAPALPGTSSSGAVWIYSDLDAEPLELRSTGAGDRFGAAAAWVDSDGDGRHELVVGSPSHTGPANLCGRVDWFRPTDLSGVGEPSRAFVGALAGDGLGAMVVSAGDLDGDGREELLVGAPDASRGQNREGLVLLYAGSETGPGPEPVWRQQGNEDFGYFGYAASPGEDSDGNGAAEILIGGWGLSQFRGEVRLFEWKDSDLSNPEWVDALQGGQTIDFLGISLDGAVDLNGAGLTDYGIGVPGEDSAGSSSGEVLWVSRAGGVFLELCSMGGEAGEQLGSDVHAQSNADGSVAWAASAPWRTRDGSRVGRVVAGRSESAVWACALRGVGRRRVKLLLRSNPVTTRSQLEIWGRAGESVEIAFLDVGGRTLHRFCADLPGGHVTLPFWRDKEALPRTGWVSLRQGSETVSTRWVWK